MRKRRARSRQTGRNSGRVAFVGQPMAAVPA
jgi:hypothetical protein